VSYNNRFGTVCGNQDAHLKFMKQNGDHFRLDYVSDPLIQLRSRGVHMAQVWGARHEIGGSCPAPRVPHLYVPALMSTFMNPAASIAV